jgi:hypothetical protein
MRDDLLGVLQYLGLEGDPHEALASKLARLFGDRIAQKRELLARVSSGGSLGDLPPAEVDEGVDVPVMSAEDATPLSQVRASGALGALGALAAVARAGAPRSSRRRRVVIALLFVLAIGLGGATGAWLRLARDAVAAQPAGPYVEPSAGTPAPVAADAAVVAVVAPPPDAAGEAAPPVIAPPEGVPDPDAITITIDTDPQGAHVIYDGEDRGVTPSKIHAKRGKRPVKLELKQGSNKPTKLAITPKSDTHLRYTFDRQLKRFLVTPPARRPARKR